MSDEASATPETVPQRPMLRVVHGDATPEEIAAIVAVLAAAGDAASSPAQRRVPEWAAHHRQVRRALPHGPGGWRSSALPR